MRRNGCLAQVDLRNFRAGDITGICYGKADGLAVDREVRIAEFGIAQTMTKGV